MNDVAKAYLIFCVVGFAGWMALSSAQDSIPPDHGKSAHVSVLVSHKVRVPCRVDLQKLVDQGQYGMISPVLGSATFPTQACGQLETVEVIRFDQRISFVDVISKIRASHQWRLANFQELVAFGAMDYTEQPVALGQSIQLPDEGLFLAGTYSPCIDYNGIGRRELNVYLLGDIPDKETEYLVVRI